MQVPATSVPRAFLRDAFHRGSAGFPASYSSVPLDKANCQSFPRVLHRGWPPRFGVWISWVLNSAIAAPGECWAGQLSAGWGGGRGAEPSLPLPRACSVPSRGLRAVARACRAFRQTPAFSWFLCTTCKDTDSCIAVSWFNLIWLAATIIFSVVLIYLRSLPPEDVYNCLDDCLLCAALVYLLTFARVRGRPRAPPRCR